MNSLQSISGFAALSEASYMDYWNNDFDVVVTAPGRVRNRLIAGGFSATLFQRIDTDSDSGLNAGFRA